MLAPGEEHARHMAYRGIITKEIHQAIKEAMRVARRRAGHSDAKGGGKEDAPSHAILALATAARKVCRAVHTKHQIIRFQAEQMTHQLIGEEGTQPTNAEGGLGNDTSTAASTQMCMGPACVKASSTLARAITLKGTCGKCKRLTKRGERLSNAARAMSGNASVLRVLAEAFRHRLQEGWVDSSSLGRDLQCLAGRETRGWSDTRGASNT